MRDRVETLERELSIKEKSLRIEKEAAVREGTKFWRDSIVEGGIHGGKIGRKDVNNFLSFMFLIIHYCTLQQLSRLQF